MPIPQSPSATPKFPNTISPPQNLDPLDAAQLNSDVETPIQDGVEAARLLLYGGGIKRRVTCTSNTVMVIQPLGAVLAAVGGTDWSVVKNLAPTTINPNALSGGLVANTRYWVYAKLSLGPVLSFIVNITAPDASLSYMTGDESALFVSTFYTDGAANIIRYKQSELNFTYLDLSSVGGNLLLSAGNAGGTINIALQNSVPSFAANFIVQALYQSGVVGTVGLVSQNSDPTNTLLFLLQGSDTDNDAAGQAKFYYDSINWSTNTNDASNALSLWIKGFDL